MTVQLAHTQEDLDKIFQLRYLVLRQPWHQPYESAMDTLDGISFNAFIPIENMCVACGRLDIIDEHTAQIRYMAVHPDYRNKNFGQKILQYLEQIAKEKKRTKIILHARENALGFYFKNNYQMVGMSHLLFNQIQHYLMQKNI